MAPHTANSEGNDSDKQASPDSNPFLKPTSSSKPKPKPKPSRVEKTNNSNSQVAPACSQCRLRKIRCDRTQPSCSNCRKASSVCDFSNCSRRVSHTKQLYVHFACSSLRTTSWSNSILMAHTESMTFPAWPPACSRLTSLLPKSPSTFTKHKMASPYRLLPLPRLLQRHAHSSSSKISN